MTTTSAESMKASAALVSFSLGRAPSEKESHEIQFVSIIVSIRLKVNSYASSCVRLDTAANDNVSVLICMKVVHSYFMYNIMNIR